MRHEFKKITARETYLDISWVEEICIHCGKDKQLTKEGEACGGMERPWQELHEE